jgi:hypothetical protein
MPNMDTTADTEVTAAEAAEILGKDRRQVTRLVKRGTLKPSRKLPGYTGAYLFWRADVEAISERAS